MDGQSNNPARNTPLAIDPGRFRALGHTLVDRIADMLESLPGRPVTTAAPPARIREMLCADRPLPERGADPSELLNRAADLLFEHSLFNGHPRFWGYITSSAAPIGALGELLAAAVNPNVGAWPLSPMASEIEAQTVRWIAEMLGYPADCGGLFVSGGNMANIVGFLAARQAKAGRDVRTSGIDGAAAAALLLEGNAHLDSESRGHFRHRHGCDSLDRRKRSNADGCCCPAAANRSRSRIGRPAVPRRWHSRNRQHRCDGSASRARCGVPRVQSLVSRGRRVWCLGRSPARCSG